MWPVKRPRNSYEAREQERRLEHSTSQQNLTQNTTFHKINSPRRLLPSLSTHSESFPPPERLPRPYGAYVIASQLVREPVSIGSKTLSVNDRVDYYNYMKAKQPGSFFPKEQQKSSIMFKSNTHLLEKSFVKNVNEKNISNVSSTKNVYNENSNINSSNYNIKERFDNNNMNNNVSHDGEDNIAIGATRISSAKRSAATLSSNGPNRSWRKGNYNNNNSSDGCSKNNYSDKSRCYNKKRSEAITDDMWNKNDDENYNNNNNENNENIENNNTSYITPDESCSVAAVINNGSSEVGVALCTFPALHIGIAQFGDSCTFSKTLTLLYTHNPVEVIVPDTTIEEDFTQSLLRAFHNEMTFTSVQRRFFNSEAGVRTLRELHSALTPSSQTTHPVKFTNNMNNLNKYYDNNEKATLFTPCSVNFEETDKYLCVAAAHALIKYLEYINDFKLLPHSLCVKQIMLEHFAEIPRSSARALHIIPPAIGMANAGLVHNNYDINASSMVVGPELQEQYNSNLPNHNIYTCDNNNNLYSMGLNSSSFANITITTTLTEALPRCATYMGQRFMRSSLLQPLREHSAIHARQDVVEWLLNDFRRALQLRNSLYRLHGLDVERLMALFAQRQNVHNDGKRRLLIQSLLDFWQACEAVLELQGMLNSLIPQDSCKDNCENDDDDKEEKEMKQNANVQPNNWEYEYANSQNNSSCKSKVNKELSALFQQRANYISNGYNNENLSGGEEEFIRNINNHNLREDPTEYKSKQSQKEIPSLLGHIIHTLQSCQLSELIAELDRYLDSSVRYVLSNDTNAPPIRQYKKKRYGGKSEYKNYKDSHLLYNALETKQQNFSSSSETTTQTPIVVGAKRNKNNDKRSVYYILRLCFAVKATVGSTLDAARNGFSTQLSHITQYHSDVQHEYQLSSLRLEADPIKLYTFSYSAAEEKKTRFGPFKYKYSWGENTLTDELNSRAFAEYQRACNNKNTNNSNTSNKNIDRIGKNSVYREDSACSSGSSLSSSWCNSPNAIYSTSKEHNTPHSYTIQRQSLQALRKRRVYCTTDTLDVLCAEARQFSTLILSESVRAVEPLLFTLRGALGSLQAMTEAIALLDMLLSFAFYSLAKQCVRPMFIHNTENKANATTVTNVKEDIHNVSDHNNNNNSFCNDIFSLQRSYHNNELENQENNGTALNVKEMVYIQDARHPSQLFNNSSSTAINNNGFGRLKGGGVYSSGCVPNTIMWAKETDVDENIETINDMNANVQPCRVLIITGPNTSGKTTLLRMTGQLFALAQSGCFIPCTSAQLFIADRIVAHMLCDELPNVMQSSFKRELVELMEISHTITHNSLVLLDELGRSCSSTCGFALAWATGCFLHKRQSYALCTSHFAGLTSLSRVLSSVGNVHFTSNVIAREKNNTIRNIINENYCVIDDNNRCSNEEESTSTTTTWATKANSEHNTTKTNKTKLTRTSLLWITHQLLPGKCTAHQYGLALATQIGLPEHVLNEANRLLHHTESKHSMSIADINESSVNTDDKNNKNRCSCDKDGDNVNNGNSDDVL